MLLYLLLFLSFVQIGLFSVGGDASAQALLEHEVLTLHHWLSPEACTDLMTLGACLPGSTAQQMAVFTGYSTTVQQLGFGGALATAAFCSLALALPALAWTGIAVRWAECNPYPMTTRCIMTLLRPLVPGLVVAAALLMAKEAGLLADATDAWHKGVSAFLFVATVVGVRVYRFNPLFMLLLCGVAGCLLL